MLEQREALGIFCLYLTDKDTEPQREKCSAQGTELGREMVSFLT